MQKSKETNELLDQIDKDQAIENSQLKQEFQV